ncbi:MAG: alpha/beta-hydrolase family protein, partial [Streptosporangiaceae bacterium]
PRGPGIPSTMQWYPFVTFWQISADLIVSSTTPGYGHYYGPEIPTAWAAILHPPGWTSADAARLPRVSGPP